MHYLKYAIGEVVLLVLGILIALQINDWYQAQQDRQQEHAYLASLQKDLADDIQRMTTAIDGNEHLESGIDELLVLLAKPRDDEAYQRFVYLHTLKYGYWFIPMEFSDLTIAQLKYSGGMQLITDPRIRQELLAYDKGIETVEAQYESLWRYFHTFEDRQKKIFNPMLSRQAFDYIEEDYMNMLKPLATFEPLVPAGEYVVNDDPQLWALYYGDMLYYKTAMGVSIQMLEGQRALAGALSKLIEARHGIIAEGG